jgi:phosphoribosylglycinamide formyltransferase-1
MQNELKLLADIYYSKILEFPRKIDITWLVRTSAMLGIKDEALEKLYALNAPISKEVWYYTFIKIHSAHKLHLFLNELQEKTGAVELGMLASKLDKLGITYDGKYKVRDFKIVVLVSGRGTNLQALIDAIENKKINARIVAVISNRKNVPAIQRAEKHGIDTFHVIAKKGEKREEYDRRIDQIVEKTGADLIVLAGFLRVLSPWFVRKYSGKIINIHPSLLPAFAGLYGENVHKAVLKRGCKITGCTVHFVTEELDSGPILIQRCVEVEENDTADTLAARVLKEEHRAMVDAVRLISDGHVEITGNRAKIR